MNGPAPLSAQSSPGLTGSPDFAILGSLHAATELVAKARLLGSRIEIRDVAADANALALAAALGLTFAFRYGVVVTIGCGEVAANTDALDAALKRHVVDTTLSRETESVIIVIRPDGEDRVGPDGQIHLAGASHERLLLAATVLARSVVLSRDETLVSEAFERISPMVADLRINGHVRLPIRSVMRLIGDVLAARHRVMGTVQVNERPDVLWDHPNLDRLYSRLEAEYELNDRSEALERKFGALGNFTEVLLDIVHEKRAVRLEVAIIMLIAFEIFLTLLKMAAP